MDRTIDRASWSEFTVRTCIRLEIGIAKPSSLRFLDPDLGTLMIIVGHGANNLTRLSTKYTTNEAIYDSCTSCPSLKMFSRLK